MMLKEIDISEHEIYVSEQNPSICLTKIGWGEACLRSMLSGGELDETLGAVLDKLNLKQVKKIIIETEDE